jgi:hypothetical protein
VIRVMTAEQGRQEDLYEAMLQIYRDESGCRGYGTPADDHTQAGRGDMRYGRARLGHRADGVGLGEYGVVSYDPDADGLGMRLDSTATDGLPIAQVLER